VDKKGEIALREALRIFKVFFGAPDSKNIPGSDGKGSTAFRPLNGQEYGKPQIAGSDFQVLS
jgi:hypothetical protein